LSISTSSHHTHRIEFTGTGSEYFRIWISNLALTVISLGIYSAWAKVRRLQYFHRNTRLDGAGCDYHADPHAILRGRLLALGLFFTYNLLGSFSVVAGLIGLVVLMVGMPWLLLRSLKFRLRYTSYRSVRFRYPAPLRGAYSAYLLWPILTGLSFGLLGPLAHLRARQFQTNHAAFGMTTFHLHARAGQFYALYGMAMGLALVLLGTLGLALWRLGTGMIEGREVGLGGIMGLIVGGVMAAWLIMIFVVAWVQARLQNLIWNATTLGNNRFASDVRPLELFGLMLMVRVLGLLTLGLYQPFGVIRLMKYRLERVAMVGAESLDDFAAGAREEVAAIGDEAVEFLDIDISL
jgi:uncharacterized membrane protein YjgN (DUF898 family)